MKKCGIPVVLQKFLEHIYVRRCSPLTSIGQSYTQAFVAAVKADPQLVGDRSVRSWHRALKIGLGFATSRYSTDSALERTARFSDRKEPDSLAGTSGLAVRLTEESSVADDVGLERLTEAAFWWNILCRDWISVAPVKDDVRAVVNWRTWS